jgi:hypothetical protein
MGSGSVQVKAHTCEQMRVCVICVSRCTYDGCAVRRVCGEEEGTQGLALWLAVLAILMYMLHNRVYACAYVRPVFCVCACIMCVHACVGLWFRTPGRC